MNGIVYNKGIIHGVRVISKSKIVHHKHMGIGYQPGGQRSFLFPRR